MRAWITQPGCSLPRALAQHRNEQGNYIAGLLSVQGFREQAHQISVSDLSLARGRHQKRVINGAAFEQGKVCQIAFRAPRALTLMHVPGNVITCSGTSSRIAAPWLAWRNATGGRTARSCPDMGHFHCEVIQSV